MMRFARWIGLVSIAGGIIAGSAGSARALELLRDGRYVHSYYRPAVISGEQPIEERLSATDWAAFDAVTRMAAQSSRMDLADGGLTMRWSAEGSARNDPDFDPEFNPSGNGSSVFSIAFRVDGEATMHLSGALDLEFFRDLDAYLSFSRTSPQPFEELIFYEDEGPFAFDLVLPPGDYEFFVRATPNPHDYGAASGFTVDFSVTDTLRPIPEPSTALLVGLGVGAAGAVSRRRS
jgi:hypothetical protein